MNTLDKLRNEANRALVTNDLPSLRRLIVDGAAFASLTIRTKTERAERLFAQWKADGRPSTLSQYGVMSANDKRLAAVLSLSDAELRTLIDLTPAERVRWFADTVYGFGYSKAAFALACSGLGYSACLDCRLIQKHRATLTPHIKTEDTLKPGWKHYASACSLVWPDVTDTAAAQWDEWLDDMARDGRETQHTLLLED